MAWDFAEVSPLSKRLAAFLASWSCVAQFLAITRGRVQLESNIPTILKRSAIDDARRPNALVLTDPPYYDAIPYSDLMDFFYVWLKRVLVGTRP